MLVNRELIELESLSSGSKKNSTELEPMVQLYSRHAKLSKVPLLRSGLTFKQCNKIKGAKRFKRRLLRLLLRRPNSGLSMLVATSEQSGERHSNKAVSRSVRFAEELVETIWHESVQEVRQVYSNIEANFVDSLVEDIFVEAYEDAKTLTRIIKVS